MLDLYQYRVILEHAQLSLISFFPVSYEYLCPFLHLTYSLSSSTLLYTSIYIYLPGYINLASISHLFTGYLSFLLLLFFFAFSLRFVRIAHT